MAYIVPRVLIKQEFTQVPVFAEQPLASLVFGPQYNLYRYSVAGEKTSTKASHPSDFELTNVYQAASDVVYNFPNQVAGTDVDADYVKEVSGYSVGGVAPVGWINSPATTLLDEALNDYDVVWAAAGHPHTVFPTTFSELIQVTGGEPAVVGD